MKVSLHCVSTCYNPMQMWLMSNVFSSGPVATGLFQFVKLFQMLEQAGAEQRSPLATASLLALLAVL